MSIANLAEYAENIFTIVFSVLWILAFLAAFVLGILWVIAAIKEKKEKARNEQLDCRSCIYFQRRIAIDKAFDALRREDSAKERENKLEENDATEKKEYENVRIELSEDKQEQDEPLPESEKLGAYKRKKYYIYGKTCEEIYGVPEERDVKVGPFDTYEKANHELEAMDAELWISGQNVYYNTHIEYEEVPERGGEE